MADATIRRFARCRSRFRQQPTDCSGRCGVKYLASELMRRTLVSLLLLSLLIGPAARSAAPIPARLADSELWSMVSTFSEPGGEFRFENFLSNEIYFQN